MKVQSWASVIPLLLLFAGCASTPPAPSINTADVTESQTRKVAEKSYERGKRASAFVGQPIITVKDFVVTTTTKTSVGSYRPDKDFTIWWATADPAVHRPIFSAKRGENIPVRGTVDLQGVSYRVIENWSHDRCVENAYCGFYVSSNGEILTSRSRFSGARSIDTQAVKVVPSDVRLTLNSEKSSQDVAQSGMGLEIIYSGRTDSQINLLYREYTKDDLARPAFFQNLTYSVGERYMRFKNFRIEVFSAANEAIQFAVVED